MKPFIIRTSAAGILAFAIGYFYGVILIKLLVN